MKTLNINDLNENERTRCEIWTRVMGYHRPVAAWNPGKQSEHAERRFFQETPQKSELEP
jgi:anaerobic ribonucleoside-triphosphate reductase